MYDPLMVQPMRDELTRVGFEELRTPEEVDDLIKKKEGTDLPPRTSPPSKLDLGPFEGHSRG